MAIFSLANIKLALQIPVSDTSQDALLNMWGAAVDKAILRLIGLTAQAVTAYSEKYDIPMAARVEDILLIRGALVAVSEVRVGTSRGNAGTALATTAFYVDLEDAAVRRQDGCYFCIGRQEVEVSYTAGFATVPADLEAAANLAVIHYFQNADKLGLTGEKIGARYSYTRSIDSDTIIAGLPQISLATVYGYVPGGGIVPRTREQ